MPPVLILTATELEARALARWLELAPAGLPRGPAYARGAVRVASVGVAAARLAERWPALRDALERPLVISAGLCGGLDPALGPGDLVVPERVDGPAGERHDVAASPHRAAVAAAPAAATGPLLSTREVVATPGAKAALFARSGAVAADMESAAILATARAAGLLALVVRAVSDGADQTVPPALSGLLSDEGTLRVGRALALIARPAVLPHALALRRSSARALRAVAGVLAALVAA